MITTEGGGQESPFCWYSVENLHELNSDKLSKIREFLYHEAGVNYTEESLRKLPISGKSPTMLLKSGREIRGIFVSTPLNATTSRVLIFAINSKNQGKGFGKECWNTYISGIQSRGYKKIQLEVKSSNKKAIRFYTERGLIVTGQIPNYYKDELGFLMEGKC